TCWPTSWNTSPSPSAAGNRAAGNRADLLKAFTPRAAGFAAAAVALYVAGRLTGVAELYMLAVAALVLPLGALAVVTWGNSRLPSSRSVRPVRTSVGNRIAVTVRLDNPTRLETGVLLLEDRLPYQLGPRSEEQT